MIAPLHAASDFTGPSRSELREPAYWRVTRRENVVISLVFEAVSIGCSAPKCGFSARFGSMSMQGHVRKLALAFVWLVPPLVLVPLA